MRSWCGFGAIIRRLLNALEWVLPVQITRGYPLPRNQKDIPWIYIEGWADAQVGRYKRPIGLSPQNQRHYEEGYSRGQGVEGLIFSRRRAAIEKQQGCVDVLGYIQVEVPAADWFELNKNPSAAIGVSADGKYCVEVRYTHDGRVLSKGLIETVSCQAGLKSVTEAIRVARVECEWWRWMMERVGGRW